MATISTVKETSIGSKKLLVATFTDSVADGDTWTSGLSSQVGILSYWATTTDASQGEEGVGVSEASGVFTFRAADTGNQVATLYVLLDQ